VCEGISAVDARGRKLDSIRRALREPGEDQLDRCAAAIRSMAGHYTGVYLYRLEDGELVLRGFAGRPSPHTRIPVGTGICGSALVERRDIVVPDVRQDDRYLACNLVGEIDIDSDVLDAFTPQDLARLREAARLLAPHMAYAGHAFASL
jgi:L-methionine (R)-S-oxide reductase